ncbi:MAG: hypothetical protein OHK0022_27600 [Roseiflexaceae bacterium]
MGAQHDQAQPPAADISEQAILAALWDSSADAMALSDPQGIVRAANAAYYALYGLTAQQVIGQSFSVIFPPEQRAWADQRYQAVFHDPELPPTFESVVQRADGTRRVVESRVSFVIQGGRRRAMLSILRDITEQHQAQEQARLFVSLVERSSDLIATVDRDGRLLFVNAAGRALLGLADDPPRLPLAELCMPETWHLLSNALALQGGVWQGEGRLRQRGGEPIDVDIALFPIGVTAGGATELLALILRDIRARKRAEGLLRESEARFRAMADSAPVLIWTSGLDKGCDYFNEPWLRFTGRTLAQETGAGWLQGVHPDDYDRCLSIYSRSFDARTPFSMEYRLRRADGEYRWLLDNGVPRYTPQGEFVGYIGSCIDITERRMLLERERAARLEAEAAVRQRDIFLSLAAHELKTPLASLLGYVQLIQRRAGRGDPLSERQARMFEIVASQGQRMNRMISALLDVSRIEVGQLMLERGRVDLGLLARRVVDEIQPALERHTVVLEDDGRPLVIDGDEVRLEQVLQNLLHNAIKYSPQGGAVVVRVAPAEDVACIAVIDQGIGIPAEALPNLFTRFFRAENADRYSISGTGIGLYVVNEIVALHGGRVAVKSTEGQGSTFAVYLPLAGE